MSRLSFSRTPRRHSTWAIKDGDVRIGSISRATGSAKGVRPWVLRVYDIYWRGSNNAPSRHGGSAVLHLRTIEECLACAEEALAWVANNQPTERKTQMIPLHTEQIARIERRVRTAGVVKSVDDDRDIVFVPTVLPTARRVTREADFPRVQDQTSIGICTGETMTTIAEAILNTRRIYTPGQDELSRRYNYYYSRHIYDNITGDKGASPRSMCRSAKNYGLPLESFWPFNTDIDQEPSANAQADAATRKLGRYELIVWDKDHPDTLAQAIDAAIAEGLLVAIAFYCRRWMFHVSGALGTLGHQAPAMDPSGPMNEIVGGHILPLQGYDRGLHPASNGAYVAQNSWGTGWGDHGLWSINRMQMIAPDFVFEVRVFREFGGITLAPAAPVPLTVAQIDAARADLQTLGIGVVGDAGGFTFAPRQDLAYFAAWEFLRSKGYDAAQAAQVAGLMPSVVDEFVNDPANVAAFNAWTRV